MNMDVIMVAFLSLLVGGFLVVCFFMHYERVFEEEDKVEESVREFRKIRKELQQIRKEMKNANKEDRT